MNNLLTQTEVNNSTECVDQEYDAERPQQIGIFVIILNVSLNQNFISRVIKVISGPVSNFCSILSKWLTNITVVIVLLVGPVSIGQHI